MAYNRHWDETWKQAPIALKRAITLQPVWIIVRWAFFLRALILPWWCYQLLAVILSSACWQYQSPKLYNLKKASFLLLPDSVIICAAVHLLRRGSSSFIFCNPCNDFWNQHCSIKITVSNIHVEHRARIFEELKQCCLPHPNVVAMWSVRLRPCSFTICS